MEGAMMPMGGAMFKTRYQGLDWSVIIAIADRRGPIDDDFFDKLHLFESATLEILNGASEDGPCTEEDRQRCIYEMGGPEYLDFQCKHCEKKKRV
jgi:hypothetical protein